MTTNSGTNNSFWNEHIHLKTLSFPRFMAAPMDGLTDSPMRQLIRDFSTHELLFTEMRHIACVANEKSGASVRFNPIEQPLAFQFSGNSTDFLEKAVAKVLAHKFVMINLNAGCPARCVINSGSGSALMAKPEKLKLLLVALQKEINGAVPLTLKIRSGFKEINALDIALMAQDCGVEMLVIHPRTQPGGFSALLDFALVQKIKQSLTIPVIFSGNINNFELAVKAYEKTGVDGFMIGRALWGCPWRIREITDAAQGIDFVFTQKQTLEYALKHLKLIIDFYGPRGVHMFKKQLPQYIKSLPNAAQLRKTLLTSQSYDEMKEQLEKLLTTLT